MCAPSGNSEFCFPSSLNVSLDFVSGKQERDSQSQENKTHYFPRERTLSVYCIVALKSTIEILGKQKPFHLITVGIFFNYIFLVQLPH